MKKNLTVYFRKTIALMIVFTSAFAFNSNSQCILLNESFDANPVLSPTNVDGAWYPDRFRPAAFVMDVLGGNNVLKISIDGLGDGALSRPSGYQGTFYNTQGRKFNQCECATILKGDLWIPSDWATDHRRSDMWATAYNATNTISAYPIIGFRNPDGASPGIYYWNGIVGWINSGVSITYDLWYNLEFRLVGPNIEYFVNGVLVATISSNGSTYLGDIIMQAYNFNDPALLPANQSADSYDAYWDNLITTGTGGLITLSIVSSSTCFSSDDGTATVTVAAGGVGPFTYLWAPGGQTASSITGLAPGEYYVTVTDIKGCTASASVSVSAGPDSDCDGVADDCDVCPGGNDNIDNNNDDLPDCKYPPAFNQIISSWKCGKKVYVAHGTGNGSCNTLCVSYNAVQAHINHGDYIGPCNHANCSEGLLQGNDRRYSLSGESVINEYINQFGSFDGEMELYPNPVQDILYVKLMFNTHSSASVQIQLLNNIGQQLFNQKFANDQDDETVFPINTQSYSNGLYFIKVTVDGTEHLKTFTILK